MHDTRQTTGFLLSLALHALLVAAAVFGVGNSLKVDMDKPMYTVDLVSLNPSEDPAAGEKGEAAGAPPTDAATEQQDASAAAIPPPPQAEKLKPEPLVRDDSKAISEKKVEEKKKPEKKEEKKVETPPQPAEKKLSREELLKEALKDVKQDVAEKSKDAAKNAAEKAKEAKKSQVSGALEALRKSEGGNIFTAGGTGPGGAGGGKGTGAGGTGSGLMSVYGDIVKQIIKKNWRYPAFGTETNVAVVVEINIDQQGKITGSRVATPSGKPDFDDSALRAVHETEKLPPPRTKSLDTLRITFNLQELRK
ncbi:MAG: cell envelope integrity protein TolA [Humidesulfovibrio sp.]|uniref:cell envelope integrity protein TolA n=1 Tax=Humidesulfovibrio sp. TaxID=2910988 RepID=UPI0027E5FC84|nr:cell envelope integrity protein TolA [Humidesulfovibrio sp.]MDQ7835217.1 cell envelope integrity protein TolA [Humidesulfovibrio sp.]